MARVSGDIEDVLAGIKKLIQSANIFADNNDVFIVDDGSLDPMTKPAKEFCTISDSDWEFQTPTNEACFAVNGNMLLFMGGLVRVTAWQRLMLDRAGRDDIRMASKTYGVKRLAKGLVNALADKDVPSGSDHLTTFPILFRTLHKAEAIAGEWYRQQVDFEVHFEWKVR